MACPANCMGFPIMDRPETLFKIAMDRLINNTDIMTEEIPGRQERILKKDMVLPSVICEKFLESYQRKYPVDEFLLHIFSDLQRTRLENVRLLNADITDTTLLMLLKHKPFELELIECEKLSDIALKYINEHSENLKTLNMGPLTNIIPMEPEDDATQDCVINAPKLRSLTVWGSGVGLFPLQLLCPLKNLKLLNLSYCNTLSNVSCLSNLQKLEVLILHDVHWLQDVIQSILTIKSICVLDISQSNERHGIYYMPDDILSAIVTSLPNLVALDISGTNLAGTGVALASQSTSHQRCDIPGLVSRTDRPLEFLGLYRTSNGACRRHDIPALMITGDANEEQVLAAVEAYVERPQMLTCAMNDLYHLVRSETCTHKTCALVLVLMAMEKHISEKHVQISGSATLFYILKGKEKVELNYWLKKRIINSLLLGMEVYKEDETVIRNGCLTLCQFKIPNDVLCEYERLVEILIRGVDVPNQQGFVQRISVYLLNSLACQVDGIRKKYLGNEGVIEEILKLISKRLDQGICDDVLEVAWSTMWNVTDETPENCKRFLDADGISVFHCCYTMFPDKDQMIRNMMGLMGNVAEVPELRPCLMDSTLLKVFHDLLLFTSDGIEVSYNAAGVIAHLASDGAENWLVNDPTRTMVLETVFIVIQRWDLKAERNINYRTLEPILKLLKAFHTPQCLHWAVWALANLTNVYPERYCYLLENEAGEDLLRAVISHPDLYNCIIELAAQVLNNCHNYVAHYGLVRPSTPDI